ncbi:MAG: histidine kinase [Bacteroidetes bacterium]|nr:histidine kinase [Bacteroidota bacterium]
MQQKVDNIEKNKRGWMTIALHGLIWLMVFLIPYIFSADVERNSHHKNATQNLFLYLTTAINFYWLILFYFNAGILMPRFIYKRKNILYALSLVAAFCIVVILDSLLFRVLSIPHPFTIYNSIGHNFIPFLITIAVSIAYKAISDKTKSDILIREKQSENLKTELSFLRSQISPHFLFNVLNNIAALVRIKSDDLEPTVIKLSSLMRYMLYETDEEKVIIKNEAAYLQDFIDLQKQRYGEELSLETVFNIKEEWQMIEPMLLIPFIENAFKHGGFVQHPEIYIQLEVDNSRLQFLVENKFEESDALKDKASGIGLTNVKRRLELLYPGSHTLTIDKKDGWFSVSLQLIFK